MCREDKKTGVYVFVGAANKLTAVNFLHGRCLLTRLFGDCPQLELENGGVTLTGGGLVKHGQAESLALPVRAGY